MMWRQSFGLIFSLFFLFCLFSQVPYTLAIKKQKLLGAKFYFHRDAYFDTYLVINHHKPTYNDSYLLGGFFPRGKHFIPIVWVSQPIPKTITLKLKYAFKYSLYLNCSKDAVGAVRISFWRYRNHTETKLYASSLSNGISETSAPSKNVWYDKINHTISFLKNDRLIVKLHLFVLDAGRFFFGFDCLQYPSYVQDPEIEYLLPEGVGTYTQWEKEFYPGYVHWNACAHRLDGGTKSSYIISSDNDDNLHKDSFVMNDTRIDDADDINSVSIQIECRSIVESNKGRAWTLIRTNNTDYLVDKGSQPTTWQNNTEEYLTHPFSGENWTKGAINDLEGGAQGKSNEKQLFPFPPTFIYYHVRCRRVWLIVEYQPPAVQEWILVESWYGELIGRIWATVESWFGELVTREWAIIDIVYGELITRVWSIIESLYGELVTREWGLIDVWLGEMLGCKWYLIESWLGELLTRQWQNKQLRLLESITVYQGSYWGIWEIHPTAGAGYSACGISFKADFDAEVTSVYFRLEKEGSPSGLLKAELYNAVNHKPSGVALATSEYLNMTNLTTNFAWYTFPFNSSEQANIDKNQWYCVECEVHKGFINASNYVYVSADTNVLAHEGKLSAYTNSYWGTLSSFEPNFKLYGETETSYYGQLTTRFWSIIEQWFGVLRGAGWGIVQALYGQLVARSVAFYMWVIALFLIFLIPILIVWRKYGFG